ncbi:BA75_01575T0 [Komagataella pastoris]|uniref:BA75_01575T0 n=1 Tax=Komagataella pastoris TaxID=4922 RepID=A0A1B2J5Q1_PICPA|nr:BA75_01575T0 [Komagataella pastoris]
MPLKYHRPYLSGDVVHTKRAVKGKENGGNLALNNGSLPLFSSIKELQGLKFEEFQELSSFIKGKKGSILDITANIDGSQEEDDDRMSVDENEDMIEETKAEKSLEDHFISLSQFEEKLLAQKELQLLTIGVDNIPSGVTRSAGLVAGFLESVIDDYLVDFLPKDENSKYFWSFVDNDVVEFKVVFMQFRSFELLQMVIQIFGKMNLKIHIPEGSKKILEQVETLERDEDADKVKEYIELISKLSSRKLHSYKSHGDVVEKLDNLSKYYNRYRIDPKELVDVPNELVDTVKKEIVEFRLNVLKLEKSKRETQMLNDKRKARMRLRRMIQLNNISGKSGNSRNEDEDEDEDEYEDENENEKQFNEMTDEEYEMRRLENVQLNHKKKFELYESSVHKNDVARINSIHNFENNIMHSSYESKLVPSRREKFLEEYVLNIKENTNSIDKNIQYYKKHVNYVNFREKVKLKEEAMDAQDREEENSEAKAVRESDQFLQSLGKKNQPQQIPDSLHEPIIEKIDQVINDLLGMTEESLTRFIFNFFRDNFFQLDHSNAEYLAFIKELEETLDEDARKASDDIEQFIRVQVSKP